ncbi:MAG: T9SS type A sorting domain-containing protein [Bacteroidota bacterium]|nr:T9SS type A sorting domain-containing protein [Bacteroidota bacterium]
MKILMLLLLMLFNVSAIHAQNCGLGYSDQIVDVFDNNIRIIQYAGFPFGYGSSCPNIDLYAFKVAQNQVVVQFFYNAAGPWSMVGCESVDSFFIDSLANSTYQLIIHTNLLIDGPTYPNLDTLYDCDIDTLNFEIMNVDEYCFGDNIKIFPNPTKDNLNIIYPVNINVKRIFLLDLQGREIKQFEKSQNELDISGISAGQYFLRLETDKGPVTKKVMIE